MIEFLYGAISVILAISIHEFSHAYAADRLGDPTARANGRLTLNPIAHFDTYGIMVMIFSQFRFGWGKPIPVDIYNLKHPKKDYALISIAGPASNFLLAFVSSLIFRIFPNDFLLTLIIVNISIGLFNLLPLFPLDGSHILPDLFPKSTGMIILILFILPIFNNTSLISYLLSPAIRFCLNLLLAI